MRVEVVCGPANAAAKVSLQKGEGVTAEAGAMIAMSDGVRVETTALQRQSGGLLKALKRVLVGESFFLNHFHTESAGEVWLAPTLAGDVRTIELTNEAYIVQSGAFLACSPGISVDLGWQGFRALLTGEGVFWLRLSGQGQAVVNAFGAIYPLDVDGEVIVDAGHIVAFPESMKFSITKAGKSWLSSILGGEGLVCKFHGKGRILCQSHNAAGFGRLIGPMLRPREK